MIAAAQNPSLVLDLDGYEGPIDLLLALARDQKVDLARISILQLADQYLAFIAVQRRLHLEIAADYLVMAAWLAYLKSRLLLPDPPADESGLSAIELAEGLAHRLRLLEAMQRAGAARPKASRRSTNRSTSSASTSCSRPMARAMAGSTARC
jgi:segregation and condensation protein A